ncbi:hypothetical protein BJ138DRAFT_993570, partial [Hygrophoropsis aurantiaca]
MPRITQDPNLAQCPDFTSDVYRDLRAVFVNATTTDDQVAERQKQFWTTTNERDKLAWQEQINADNEARIQQQQTVDAIAAQKREDLAKEAEVALREERKKNRVKYINIPDRPPPSTTARAIACDAYATRRLDQGLYVELHYFTPHGLKLSQTATGAENSEALQPIQNANGTTGWIAAAATRNAATVVADKDLTFEEFCIAVPRMLRAM